jgi:transcriptional regulator with XRE-family HTH domain
MIYFKRGKLSPAGFSLFGAGGRDMADSIVLLSDLDKRRRELGLSYDLLSKRCGVSRPTVQRILSGRHPTASFSNVIAIAEALGLALRFGSQVAVPKMKREQARKKARKLVALVQGTSGLEGQAVDRESLDAMVEQTTHELLAGSKRKLWGDG